MARTYKCTWKCTAADGTLVEPGMHYQTDVATGGSEPDPNDVAEAIRSHLGASFSAITPASVFITSLDIRELVIPPDIGAAGTAPHNLAGAAGDGDNKLPKGLVPIIQFKTATASRSARGYTVPSDPHDGGTLAAGVWTSAYQALLQAYANKLVDVLSVGTLFPTAIRPVCYSRTRHVLDADPWTFDLTAAVAKATPHWRRSRMTNP